MIVAWVCAPKSAPTEDRVNPESPAAVSLANQTAPSPTPVPTAIPIPTLAPTPTPTPTPKPLTPQEQAANSVAYQKLLEDTAAKNNAQTMTMTELKTWTESNGFMVV